MPWIGKVSTRRPKPPGVEADERGHAWARAVKAVNRGRAYQNIERLAAATERIAVALERRGAA